MSTRKAGAIRWTGTGFEGWNEQWMSLPNSSETIGSGSVTDIDGNHYLTVTIDTHTWMRKNRRTSHHCDGTPILEKTLNSDWYSESPTWCWYENNHAYQHSYGKHYNWYPIGVSSVSSEKGWGFWWAMNEISR